MITAGNEQAVRSALLKEIFGHGTNTIDEATIDKVVLKRHGGKELTAKKLKSLSKKYFSIPPDKLAYYPNVSEAILEAAGSESDDEEEAGHQNRDPQRNASSPAPPVTRRKELVRKRKVIAVGVNAPKMPAKLGRPKKNKGPILPGQKSILSFFGAEGHYSSNGDDFCFLFFS